ncbi:MAG TPA: excinuclease ABC subunit UvrC [Sulfurovum sp.]|nr:excinuclease ABC subunit UvrC [Sulfurovum sp.]
MHNILDSIIKDLPSSSGIYQYFDKNSKLLYIGKAKNLSNRVKSYWRFTPSIHPNPTQSSRIIKMLNETCSIDYIVVDNEDDALILENSLIKQLKPKYNILLRDDKTYPYIYIDESQDFPRFELTRKIVKGKNISYYGPFPTGSRALMAAIYEIYPLVQKRSGLEGGEACLFYEIGKCHAPCEGKISKEAYHNIISMVKQSINKRRIIIAKLQERMLTVATQERYEDAAKIRDQIATIKALKIHSSIDLASQENLDIFAILNGDRHDGDKHGVVVRMFMREGKIISSSHNLFTKTDMFDQDEAYKQVLLDFYSTDLPFVPKEILVADDFLSAKEMSQTLSNLMGKSIHIKHPKRGSKHKLINLSLANAKELLRQKRSTSIEIEEEISKLFELDSIPYRVEVFDNSHMMGVATVGAMVTWDNGKWDKSSYRRYELSSKDEYAQMTEMLERRIRNFDKEPPPDLWVLDGGKANLNLAYTLLGMAGINLNVIAIAKEKLDSKAHRAKGAAKDLVHTSQKIYELKTSDKRLQWVQLLRDESHRFVITYHQNKKRRDDTQISLLNKKGIGKATIKRLIDYFGTFENIQKASHADISIATNKKIADILGNLE